MSDERRVVTVLFADVTGSTALGETLDPEDLRALLSRYYAIAKEVVAAHGGTVEKFIGDAVMAVFGLRRAHGDDAVRALSAAMELRDRVRSDPRLGERMPIRLGVNTGDVVASRDTGSEDFLVTGDAVNVAARIQQNAASWSIVVGERTMRAARSAFRFGPSRQVEAKGKTEPLLVCELLGRAHSMASRTPIFGRDADLAQMDLVARRAFQEQRPFLVTIIAPAGTGKTRVLEEFLDRLAHVAPDAQVAVAQCLPYGQRLTYWPLRAVLFRIVGLDEDAPATEVRSMVDAWLTKAGVEAAADVGLLLASTIGAAESETMDRAALFAAWRTFVEAASRQAPLVVAVEDLHWSSDTLLDLFEFVLQPRGDTRALLIALARPELLDRRPNWGGGRRNHVSIALEPLDDRSTARLVRTIAEGAPDGLVDAIVARAEGNPFFAGEIVNAVIESVQSFDNPDQVHAALARLPDTVQATVLARLDELPEDEREVLRVGSVFGRTFRPTGVAALIGREGADGEWVGEICERLAERDLVRPTGADGFTFRHIVIREVAFSTLSRSSRATLHGAAGRWLADHATGREEELAELVAYHFREAASLAMAMELDDAEALRDSAREWLVRAAEVARSAAANIEAREHVRAALEFARPDDLPELYELLGDVEIGGGPILAAYATALDLAKQAGLSDDTQLRLLAKQLMIEMRSQGAVANRRSAEQIDEMRSAGRALLDRSADPLSRAMFLAADAFFPFWSRIIVGPGDEASLVAAESSAREALDLALMLDDMNIQSAALDALGSLALQRGDPAQTIALSRERFAKGPRLALTEQIDAYSAATWAEVQLGDLAGADMDSAAGLAIIQPGQSPDWTLHLVAWRALTLQLLGKWDEGLATVEHAQRLWLESGRPAAGYSTRGFLAGVVMARARRDETLAQRIVSVIDEIMGHFPHLPRFDKVAAIIHGDLDGVAAALTAPGGLRDTFGFEYIAQALSVCTDVTRYVSRDELLVALSRARGQNARLLEAEIQRAIGLADGDRGPLGAALQIFERSGARPYAARVRIELALVDGDQPEFDQALDALEKIGDVVQAERYLKRWSSR